ncbi:MAG TPA: thermonuclease family protein [Steroidobacteraceae bacterium]|nr:thermonuclease family protein [Steroidobacteraceae bacterium]
MRSLFPVAIICVALAAPPASGAEVSGPAHIKDADTIEVRGSIFRLHGIDAPELDQSCLDAEGALYACGRDAVRELRGLIAERTVICEDRGPDSAYPKRRIGRCSVGGTDLHRWLVQNGWAVNFEPYAKGEFLADEEDARRGRLGIWKGCFVAPRDFRHWNNGKGKLLGPECPQDARGKLFPDVADMLSGCEIKGHYSRRAWPYKGIYHLPGCRSYRRTKAKRWFCSEEDAIAAGFRKAFTCDWH